MKLHTKSKNTSLFKIESLVEYLIKFTKTYKDFSDNNRERREIACLRVQFPFILREIEPGDFFAGRILHPPLGFSPQMGGGFGYYFDEQKFEELLNDPELSAKDRRILEDMSRFWQTENTAYKTRQAYPPHLHKLLPSDNWNGESGIGFPLYRMAGSNLNYDKLLRLGIPGLRNEIHHFKNKTNDTSAIQLYDAMEIALDLLSDVCLSYAEKATGQLSFSNSAKEHDRLKLLAASLRHIAAHKPESFHQAIQLFWIYSLLSGNVDYGRLDVYLVDFFAHDINNNIITKDETLDMLMSLWRLIQEREEGIWIFDSRVIIGGKGRRNEKMADDLALLCIEATRRMHHIMPQLTLRFYDGQNPELYKKALDCIAENNPYPMLYNDDVNIPAIAHAFDIPREDAENYCPFGCGEYVIEHQSFGTPSGVINMLQALLVTLNRGVDPTRGSSMGMPAETIGSLETFDDLYSAYKKQIEAHVKVLAEQEYLEYQIAGQTAPFLYFSLLFDDCIERGKAIFDGGIKHLGGTLESYGNSNTADSLLAIKKLVYEDEKFSLDELVEMLNKNFVGYERERRMLLEAPKYGNDNDEADAMLCDVNEHIFSVTRQQREHTGLDSYLIVVINNNANTVMGRYTGASPDGRLAGSPMNNGNAPSSGMDKNGVTAFLNSIVKPRTDIHAGATQNMKFSTDLFRHHRDKINILLDTYWESGGAQAMLTVLGREDLQNAIKYPDNYQNLIVRVGGYSAKFVDLEPDIQQEILARTLY